MANQPDSAATVTEEQASPPADDTQVTEQIDWEARATELESRAVKAEKDLDSATGRLRRQSEGDARFQSLEDGINTNTAFLKTLAKHQASGDMEGLEGELQTQEAESSQRREISRVSNKIATRADDIKQAIADAGLDINSSPELSEVRELWGEAKALTNTGTLRDIREAQDILVDALAATLKVGVQTAGTKAKQEAEASLKSERAKIVSDAEERALEDVGAHSLDTGRSSASGAPESLEQLNKVDTRKMKGKALTDHGIKVEAAIARQSG